MKTLLTILVAAFLGTMVSASPEVKSDYLVTKEGKIVVAKVKLGAFRIHAKSANGCILEVNYKNVASYQKNGETYSRKPLYNGKKNTGNMVFMRLISRKNGLNLYCFEESASNNEMVKRYFVFKDNNTLWLEVDARNSETIRNFFSM